MSERTLSRRRVVITGLGAVTPIGNTAEEFWSGLVQGRSGIGPITRFDASAYPTRIAGEVRGFDALKYIDKKDDRKFDPFLKYAVACALMAVEDAGLDLEQVDKTRFGVLVGSGIGGISTLLDSHDVFTAKGPDRVSPFFVPDAHHQHGVGDHLHAPRRPRPELRRWSRPAPPATTPSATP